MRAQLRYLHSADADLPSFEPPNPECFSVFLQMMVGPEGAEGTESFEIEVLTPRFLDSVMRSEERGGRVLETGAHRVFVVKYDYAVLHSKLSELVASCTGDDWAAVAAQVACIGRWEFDQYQEYIGARADGGGDDGDGRGQG